MSETTKALFKDALYQVLDNKVFRILTVLIVFLVLPTFLISAKTEQLSVFWGWRTYAYQDVFNAFNLPYPGLDEQAHATLIQAVQKLLVEQLAGNFGLIFAIAATAFFVPRMVEKGAADTIFSKPVSRIALLLSRYTAGLLFVGILAGVLVLGMHVGLLLNSGYSDAGFLWAIPVMVYKYAILHAFSLLVAVWTRSSVAAILTTLMFFAFNGCVHAGWGVKEMELERDRVRVEAGENKEGDDPSALLDTFLFVLDTLHYTLPKTSDASVISTKLRRAIAERRLAFKDETSGLKIGHAPEGFTPLPVTAADLPKIAEWKRPEGEGRIVLQRWDYKQRKLKDARAELDKQLADRGIRDVKKDRVWVMEERADSRSWQETRGDVRLRGRSYLLMGQGFVFQIDVELPEETPEATDAPAEKTAAEPSPPPPSGGSESGAARPSPAAAGASPRPDSDEVREFLSSFEQEGAASGDPHDYMERRARWGGPLKYNLWFSLTSTLAFIAVLLALAWWRLSWIDF